MTLRQSIILMAAPILVSPLPVLAQEDERRVETSGEDEEERTRAFSLRLLYRLISSAWRQARTHGVRGFWTMPT